MKEHSMTSTATSQEAPCSRKRSQLAQSILTAACAAGLTVAAWVALVMLLSHFGFHDGIVWSGTLWFSAMVCTGSVAYSRYSAQPVLGCTIAFGIFGLTYMACEGPIFGDVSNGGDPSVTEFVVLNLAFLPLGVFTATEAGRWLRYRIGHERHTTDPAGTSLPN